MPEPSSEKPHLNPHETDINRILSSEHPLQTIKEVIPRIPHRWSTEDALRLKQQLNHSESRQLAQTEMLWYCLPQISRICTKFHLFKLPEQELLGLCLTSCQKALDNWTFIPGDRNSYCRGCVYRQMDTDLQEFLCDRFQLALAFFPTIKLFYDSLAEYQKETDKVPNPDDVDISHLKAIFDEKIEIENKERGVPVERYYSEFRGPGKPPATIDAFDTISNIYFSTTDRELIGLPQPGSTEESALQNLTEQQLLELLDTLTPRQSLVLKLRYGLKDGHSYTHGEIAGKLNLTRERIRQIEAKALRKLRHPTGRNLLTGYFK